MSDRSVAVVTGANRGIGLEVVHQLAARGYLALLTGRGEAKGEVAAADLAARADLFTGTVVTRPLDVTAPTSVEAFTRWLADEVGRLDVLVNNAAIHYDTWQTPLSADMRVVSEALETNLLGAWRVSGALVPLMLDGPRSGRRGARLTGRRVVNVSSGAGSLHRMRAGTPAYSVSKAALNALTVQLASELHATGILVNAACPGWVATDMGGPGGRPLADGAASVLWAVDIRTTDRPVAFPRRPTRPLVEPPIPFWGRLGARTPAARDRRARLAAQARRAVASAPPDTAVAGADPTEHGRAASRHRGVPKTWVQ